VILFFFRVEDYESQFWLTPCTELPAVDQIIFSCQYNSPINDRQLQAYKNIPKFSHSVEAINGALYVDRCSVSIGKVLAKNDYQVSLNTSCLFGASGAPCMGMNQVESKFCAIYLGSLKDENGNFRKDIDNHALHVDHPYFARTFINTVLSDLPDKTQLTEYLNKHQK